MSLKSAVSFLKSVPDISRDTYAFHEGWVYAASPAILAAYPVPHMQGTFGLRASELSRVVTRMAVEPVIEAGDGTLVLRKGRLRSAIDLLDVEPPPNPLHAEEEQPDPLPEGFMEALEKVLPFISKDGAWQKSVQIIPGALRAISGQCSCVVDVPSLTVEAGAVVITDDAARYLASLDAPSGWRQLPGALGFFWPSGAWMRCQLSVFPWPALADTVFKLADAEPTVEITEELREALADVSALGDGHVDITPTSVVGKTPTGKHTAEFTTGLKEDTRWKIEALANVIKIATAWSPDLKPAPFRGEGCRGVIMKLTR